MKNRLIIISYDAMVREDLDELTGLPCFGRLWNEGARIDRIRTIYPSLTYPSHVSILTGTAAGRHGIVNNEPFEAGNLKTDWYWFHEPVKVRDLHDAAKAAGLTTASVFWPVSGAHKSIDYLVAEYWAQGKNDTLEAAYKRAGTSDELFEDVVKPLIPKLDSWESPVTDEGKILLACEIVKRYKPDLLTLHLGQVDYYRHRFGLFNDKVSDGVFQSERFLQMMIDACAEAGVLEETTFAVISDHGQIEYDRKMNLNLLFREAGYLSADENGALANWTVYAKSANYSAHIYLKDPADEALKQEVYEKLLAWKNTDGMGIGAVYTAEEAREKYGLYGDFSFVIESDDHTLFNSKWTEPLFTAGAPKPGYSLASHGHDPAVGPQPIFLMMGPAVRSGAVLETGSILSEAPTFARILGIDLPDAEGKAFEELLKD